MAKQKAPLFKTETTSIDTGKLQAEAVTIGTNLSFQVAKQGTPADTKSFKVAGEKPVLS